MHSHGGSSKATGAGLLGLRRGRLGDGGRTRPRPGRCGPGRPADGQPQPGHSSATDLPGKRPRFGQVPVGVGHERLSGVLSGRFRRISVQGGPPGGTHDARPLPADPRPGSTPPPGHTALQSGPAPAQIPHLTCSFPPHHSHLTCPRPQPPLQPSSSSSFPS